MPPLRLKSEIGKRRAAIEDGEIGQDEDKEEGGGGGGVEQIAIRPGGLREIDVGEGPRRIT